MTLQLCFTGPLQTGRVCKTDDYPLLVVMEVGQKCKVIAPQIKYEFQKFLWHQNYSSFDVESNELKLLSFSDLILLNNPDAII